jgi:3-oxoadipate enol-lactonase
VSGPAPRTARWIGSHTPEPVVVLSSLGTPSELWDRVAQELAAARGVLAVEHPGHVPGAGPVPVATSIGAYADEVAATMDGEGIERAHLVGVSIGGAIALETARLHPERIASLVVVGTPSRFGEPTVWLARAAQVRAEGTAPLIAGLAARWLPPGFGERHPEVLAAIERWITTCDAEAYARHCEALASWDASGGLGEIVAPTLVVTGRFDPVAPPEEALALARALPAAALVVLGASAHLPPLSEPHSLAVLIAAHVQGALVTSPSSDEQS